MIQDLPAPRTIPHLQPGDLHHYRGFEIYLSDARRQLVSPYFITGLRRACRDIAHGEEIIDAYHAKQAEPREPGSLRILAADVRVTNQLSASECRNRVERARGQHRKGGRFAKADPARMAQPEQQQLARTGVVEAPIQHHESDGPHPQLEQQQAQRALTAPTQALPLPCPVTQDDLGFEPFTAEDIAENIERGEALSMSIYQVGKKPTLMACAYTLGNLSGIAEQQRLEIGRLRAELARVQAAAHPGAPRSKPGLGRRKAGQA